MRTSGILLHITSLPSPYGIGDLGPAAYAMADFFKAAGQGRWQVLPVNPTDGINGHSPYSCFSAFAGNPLLISPQLMVSDGLLLPKDIRGLPAFDKGTVDYARAGVFKQKLFNKAHGYWFRKKERGDYVHFCLTHKTWLDDFALFQTAKDVFKGKSWAEWPKDLRWRRPRALAKFAKDHTRAVERVKFIQYVFFHQWQRFKDYANARQLEIIGDIPIYVNYDSAEVWCYPQFFKLDERRELKFVSGCPPDYFSKTGQRWGNPVFDWQAMKKDKYGWWKDRIQHNLALFDFVRIDHFRGFDSYWQIPAHEKFAVFGRWTKGPGAGFFKVLQAEFKHLPVIAEDLGEITNDVIRLMKQFKFPGMRVLMFAFGGDLKTNPHVPANYPSHCVAFTGTHDNNTVQGWFHTEAKAHEKANIVRVLGRKAAPRQLHWAFIEAVMRSKADTAIVPLSDVLGLGAEARMNTPATKVHNWKWQVNPRLLTSSARNKLLHLTRQYKRLPS